MANVSELHQEGKLIDYTPSGAVTAGNIINLGAQSVLAPVGIAASTLGGVEVEGVIDGPFVGQIGNIGDNVWWDANGTPTGGSADGAFTINATAGDWWVGTLIKATVAADATCKFAMNVANPNIPAWVNRAHVLTAVDLTWAAATHNGMVIHVTADVGFDTTVTMPIGVAGMEAIIVNDEADGINGLIVDFNGNETLEGNLTIAATKTAINTLATSIKGDYLHIICETAASLWVCVEKRGTWVTSV